MKILCCGDRDWKSWDAIRAVLRGLPPETVVIHGAARGADKMCAWIAEHSLHFKVIPVPADWDRFKKAAGPIRNQKMLDDHPDIEVVYAFHDDLPSSKGTKDMCERAHSAGKIIFVVTSAGSVQPYQPH